MKFSKRAGARSQNPRQWLAVLQAVVPQYEMQLVEFTIYLSVLLVHLTPGSKMRSPKLENISENLAYNIFR